MTEHLDYQPVKVLELELAEPLPTYNMATDEKMYDKAFLFVRLFGIPIGTFEMDAPEATLTPESYVPRVWEQFHASINACLRKNGIATIDTLTAEGIVAEQTPLFWQQREETLKNAPPVSIVIPTRGRPTTLGGTLRSLLDLDYPEFQIVIVDNDDEKSHTYQLFLDEFKYEPRIKYVFCSKAGTAGARNVGWQHADYDMIAYTDDDVIVDKNWLTNLMQGFDAAPEIACVTGLTLPYELETQTQEWFQKNSGFDRGYEQLIVDTDEHRPDKLFFPYTVGIMGTSANMAIKKSALQAIDGFDTRLGGGTPVFAGEENDLYFRLLTNGFRMVYHPNAVAWHIHRRDYAVYRKRTYRYGVSLTGYITKHLLEKPSRIPGFLAKVPIALWLLASPKSVHNEDKPSNFPSELRWLELAGFARGPLAFLGQRIKYNGKQRPLNEVEVYERDTASTTV